MSHPYKPAGESEEHLRHQMRRGGTFTRGIPSKRDAGGEVSTDIPRRPGAEPTALPYDPRQKSNAGVVLTPLPYDPHQKSSAGVQPTQIDYDPLRTGGSTGVMPKPPYMVTKILRERGPQAWMWDWVRERGSNGIYPPGEWVPLLQAQAQAGAVGARELFNFCKQVNDGLQRQGIPYQ